MGRWRHRKVKRFRGVWRAVIGDIHLGGSQIEESEVWKRVHALRLNKSFALDAEALDALFFNDKPEQKRQIGTVATEFEDEQI